MSDEQTPHTTVDDADGPPLREDYGGPRRASDGTRVTPDPSEGVDTPASAAEGKPSSGGSSPGDRDHTT